MDPETLLNPYVAIYLAVVVLLPLIPPWIAGQRRKAVEERRAAQGLPSPPLVSAAARLAEIKRDATLQAFLLIATIVVTPFVLALVAEVQTTDASEEKQGLAITFAGLILWLLLQGTDVARGFLGGLAFKTLAAYKSPIQVGDRVTLKGIGGTVTDLGVCYVTLVTPDDDQVSIPTSSLWSDVLISANAGDRASLSVMRFYLSPRTPADKRDAAENAIWDSIQASPYLDSSRPMQIFYAQEPGHICLTAKAYVASTYHDPIFSSEVTRAFLEFAAQEGVELAAPPWPAKAG